MTLTKDFTFHIFVDLKSITHLDSAQSNVTNMHVRSVIQDYILALPKELVIENRLVEICLIPTMGPSMYFVKSRIDDFRMEKYVQYLQQKITIYTDVRFNVKSNYEVSYEPLKANKVERE